MIKENYRHQYDNWHQDTEESKAKDIQGSTDFINIHGLWPNNKEAEIFDIGCGMGRLLLAYKEKGYFKLGGIDIDDYQIEVAKKENLRVYLTDADTYFKKNQKLYELILMIDCLEHIEKNKQLELLASIYDSLGDDGSVVIRVPNALSPTFGYMRYVDFTHKVSYTVESLSYLLKNAGFDSIVFRPAWQETQDIIRSKKPFAELLKAEFGIDGAILTANLVAVAFKSQKAMSKYLNSVPEIEINYHHAND